MDHRVSLPSVGASEDDPVDGCLELVSSANGDVLHLFHLLSLVFCGGLGEFPAIRIADLKPAV